MEIELKFDEKGLIPTVIQDGESNEVLMVAYMNKESFEATLKEGRTCFWSRSRQILWRKGETSGHVHLIGLSVLYHGRNQAFFIESQFNLHRFSLWAFVVSTNSVSTLPSALSSF